MESKTTNGPNTIDSSESEDSSVYGITKSNTNRFWIKKSKNNLQSDHQNDLNHESEDSFSRHECRSDSALGSSDKESTTPDNTTLLLKTNMLRTHHTKYDTQMGESAHIYNGKNISNGKYLNSIGKLQRTKSTSASKYRNRSTLHIQYKNRRRSNSKSSESSYHGSSERRKMLEDIRSRNVSSSRSSREHSKEKDRKDLKKQIEKSKSRNTLKSVVGVVKTNRMIQSKDYNRDDIINRDDNRSINYSKIISRDQKKLRERHPSYIRERNKIPYQNGINHKEKIDICNRSDNIRKKDLPYSFINNSQEYIENYNHSQKDPIQKYNEQYRNSSPENRRVQSHLLHGSSPCSYNSFQSLHQPRQEQYSRYVTCHENQNISVCRIEHCTDLNLMGSSVYHSGVSSRRPCSDLPQRTQRPALLPTPSTGPSQATCCCSCNFSKDVNVPKERQPRPALTQHQVTDSVGSSTWNLACKVYVGGLSLEATRQQLKQAFIKFGPLRNLWLAKNPPGFGFVEFETEEEARSAVQEDGRLRVGVTLVKIEMSWTPFPGKYTNNKNAQLNQNKDKTILKVEYERSYTSSSSKKPVLSPSI